MCLNISDEGLCRQCFEINATSLLSKDYKRILKLLSTSQHYPRNPLPQVVDRRAVVQCITMKSVMPIWICYSQWRVLEYERSSQLANQKKYYDYIRANLIGLVYMSFWEVIFWSDWTNIYNNITWTDGSIVHYQRMRPIEMVKKEMKKKITVSDICEEWHIYSRFRNIWLW